MRRSFASTDFPDAESVRYSLFRAITTDSATFNTGYDLTKFDDLLKPSTTYNAGTNVIDFGVWFYRESDTGDLERIFPISSETSFSVKDQDAPAYVDVMVRILTEEGAAKISAIERGLVFMPAEFGNDYGAWWWSVANAHSRVFVRRIALRSVAF
ncbi:MAG: hypothetical protein NVV63_13020 [Opitutus sp.]|nr:hypothetical protein [Opitutus sp.]